MADGPRLTEQKQFHGGAGLYGGPWREHEQYVAWLSSFDPSKMPVRTGNPIVFPKPIRYLQPCPRDMHVRNTRYMFPSGLDYKKWGFSGTLHSAPKIDVNAPGFVLGQSSSVSDFPSNQQVHL